MKFFSHLVVVSLMSCLLANPAVIVAAEPTRIILRHDALRNGYTVYNTTGTVALGVRPRSIARTNHVRITITKIKRPERYPIGEQVLLSDLHRYTVRSSERFKLKKKLWLSLSYPAAVTDTPKVLKYWDSSSQRWRRVKASRNDTGHLQVHGALRHKQAILGVFAKTVQPQGDIVQGLASWYDWTGAACNDFPIGSMIRVTNVASGAYVDSRVVSTGPFMAGRVVDLPRADFEKIANLSAGVVEVTVQQL